MGIPRENRALAFRTRPLTPADASLAAQWMIAEWGLDRKSERAYASLFEALIGEERIRGGCIEAMRSKGGGWTLEAIGLSGFVTEDFIGEYLTAPTPYPSMALLDRVRAGDRSVLLDEAGVGAANAGGGLNQMTVYYGQLVKDPRDPRCREMLPATHKLHREVHGGYRMRRFLQDEWSANEEVFVYAGYRVITRFPEGTPCPAGLPPLRSPRTLIGLTEAEAAKELPGSTVSFLFEHTPPRLALSRAQRRLLRHAAAGFTDKDIAEALGLSPNTLKATWRDIYAQFDERLAFVLSCESAGKASQRGPEKRRRAIAYLQDHPEEMRPWFRA